MSGPPGTYYQKSHQESIKTRGILIDDDETRIVLQILSKTVIGPIFFEFIVRKGVSGSKRAISALCFNPSRKSRFCAAS